MGYFGTVWGGVGYYSDLGMDSGTVQKRLKMTMVCWDIKGQCWVEGRIYKIIGNSYMGYSRGW